MANTNKIIDKLPAATKQEVRNASDGVYNSIAHAMRVCVEQEDRQRRHEAFKNAKKQVFRAELKILMYSNPRNYQKLCDLLDKASKIAQDTNKIIDKLPEATRQKVRNASFALHSAAYGSIEFAVGVCGPQEASEQKKQEALRNAENKVRQFESNMLGMQDQMNRARTWQFGEKLQRPSLMR